MAKYEPNCINNKGWNYITRETWELIRDTPELREYAQEMTLKAIAAGDTDEDLTRLARRIRSRMEKEAPVSMAAPLSYWGQVLFETLETVDFEGMAYCMACTVRRALEKGKRNGKQRNAGSNATDREKSLEEHGDLGV